MNDEDHIVTFWKSKKSQIIMTFGWTHGFNPNRPHILDLNWLRIGMNWSKPTRTRLSRPKSVVRYDPVVTWILAWLDSGQTWAELDHQAVSCACNERAMRVSVACTAHDGCSDLAPGLPHANRWRVRALRCVPESKFYEFFSMLIYIKSWTYWYNYFKVLTYGSSILIKG